MIVRFITTCTLTLLRGLVMNVSSLIARRLLHLLLISATVSQIEKTALLPDDSPVTERFETRVVCCCASCRPQSARPMRLPSSRSSRTCHTCISPERNSPLAKPLPLIPTVQWYVSNHNCAGEVDCKGTVSSANQNFSKFFLLGKGCAPVFGAANPKYNLHEQHH